MKTARTMDLAYFLEMVDLRMSSFGEIDSTGYHELTNEHF